MTFDLHVLGVASARPSHDRSVSGSILKTSEGLVCIDAGEGFQIRLADQRKHIKTYDSKSRLRTSKLNLILLTHGHMDHTWGLLPWIKSLSLEGRRDELLVMGPTSTEVYELIKKHGYDADLPKSVPTAELFRQIKHWIAMGGRSSELNYNIRWVLGDINTDSWIEIESDTLEIIELDKMPQPASWSEHYVHPIPTVHSVPSCAWRIASKPKQGKFDRKKADLSGLSVEEKKSLSLGVDVVKGETKFRASEFRSVGKKGVSIVISGDTAAPCDGLSKMEGADVLVHECTYLSQHSEKASEYMHSTTLGALENALASNSKFLALTHYSARIDDVSDALNEVKGNLGDSEIGLCALNDGDRIILSEDGIVQHLAKKETGWS